MLIYGYKGKKCPISLDINNNTNLWALFRYNEDIFKNNQINNELWLRHVFNSYTILCKLNNSLVNTYEVNDNYIESISFVKEYLEKNHDIESSIDSKCRNIYDHLKIWYKRLCNNHNSLDEIKWQVVKTMKYYEKQEIFKIVSINLKQNYQDFVI